MNRAAATFLILLFAAFLSKVSEERCSRELLYFRTIVRNDHPSLPARIVNS